MLNYSNNIRVIRLVRGMKQCELARRAGFPNSCVSNIERGLRPTHDEHFDRIAAVLGVSREAITNGDMRARLLPQVTAR